MFIFDPLLLIVISVSTENIVTDDGMVSRGKNAGRRTEKSGEPAGQETCATPGWSGASTNIGLACLNRRV
jgi:hypothetical protein